MEKKDYKYLMKNLNLVTQLGLTMVGSILFCFAVGYFLDKWLGTKGVFITLFLLFGIGGGAYTVYRQINEAFQDAGDKDTRDVGKK